MNNEIKEIYLSNLEWTKTHDNMGGVMGNVVFKDNISYEEYNKLFKSGYFILCDKDYIINLQEENEKLKNLEYKFFYCSDEEESFTLNDYLELGNKVYDLQEENDRHFKEAIRYENACDELEIRIDKAIEYITTEQLYTNYQWGKSQYMKILKDLLNILKGNDKDE